jgi:outer membrane autotransporter protein
MRKLLATAVALGPLMVASGAYAETVISNTRTTPIATSTATGSGADNVRIAAGGQVKVTSGAAVTLDSNNTVVNQGEVRIEPAADGSTGILVVGGHTGSVTNAGNITILDDFVPTDGDNDGDLDGQFSHGTNRAGIRLAGGGAFTGNILNDTGGAITVEGNQSYGILLDEALIGDLVNKGSIRVGGDGSYGIRVVDPITGKVTIRGSVSISGAAAEAVSIAGNVSGRLTLGGVITGTGYRYTTAPTSSTALNALDADDKLQGGPAVRIAGNMGGGVLIDAPVTDKDTNNNDEDADGVTDTEQTAGVITSFGSAPGLLVGSDTQSVTLSTVGAAANYNFGFVNKGVVSGVGVYSGAEAIGVQVGTCAALTFCAAPQTTTITNGIRNVGDISGTALEASAYGVILGRATNVPTVKNEGAIRAVVTAETAVAVGSRQAIALLIEPTSATTTLNNEKGATISATVTGENASAYAVFDRSGNLTTINNSGIIFAAITATDGDDPGSTPNDEIIKGSAVALDLSANTTGVTYTQVGVNDGDDGADNNADPDFDSDGVDDADEPLLQGAVLLGSGNDTLNFQNGYMTGEIRSGDGLDTLNISGGAQVTTQLLDHDGQLNITVSKGLLEVRNALYSDASCTTLNTAGLPCRTVIASNLTVGADGDLVVTFNPNAPAAAFNVSGTATFANGAGVGVRFTDLVKTFDSNGVAHFTVVQAGTLNAGAIDITALNSNTPYLYKVTLDPSTPANQLGVAVTRRTAAEAGMNAVETAAFASLYAGLGIDSELRDAFLLQTNRADFFNLYEQLLPEHSGAPLLSLAAGVDAVSRALGDRRPEAEDGEVTGWVQEINFYADKDKGGSYGFRTDGFGMAGGLERRVGGIGALGLSLAFTSSDMKDPEAEGDENLTAELFEVGGYWRANAQNWRAWARGAVGYGRFDSTRQFVGGGISRKSDSTYNGYSAAAGAGLAYEANFGRFFLRPEISAEYFSLTEEAHEERGGAGSNGQNGFDLAIEERNGKLFRTAAMLSFGGKFGDQGWLQPELRVGWRQNVTADLDPTRACIIGLPASDPNRCFDLTTDSIEGGGPVVGLRILANGQMGFLALEADAELMDLYARYSLMLRAGYRF